MGEPIWTNFSTKVPAGWHSDEQPLWIVDALGEALNNGHTDVEAEPNGAISISANGEGNYGLLDGDLELVLDWCRAHRVPFIANDESKYDCSGQIIVFDGTKEWEGRYDQGVVLDSMQYQAIVAGEHSDFESVDDYFTRLNISINDLDIAHLPDELDKDARNGEPPWT